MVEVEGDAWWLVAEPRQGISGNYRRCRNCHLVVTRIGSTLEWIHAITARRSCGLDYLLVQVMEPMNG